MNQISDSNTPGARFLAAVRSEKPLQVVGAIGALKGPKHGGANEAALAIQSRYATADEAEADVRRRFPEAQQKRILEASLDGERLESMAVNEYVDLYALVP